MEVRKNIKRIASLGMGVLMLGATLLGAGAVAMEDYPGSFFDSGHFNAAIVVGENAASSDVVGAINLATSLQRFSDEQPEPTAASGYNNRAKLEESNDALELFESMGDVKETLTEDDLTALQGGELRTSSGKTDYSQYIHLEDNPSSVVYEENEDDEVGAYYKVDDGDLLFEYELEFHSGFESDVDGDKLEDYEDERFMFGAKEYSIVDAELDGDYLSMTLMGGSVEGFLYEGESRTYEVNGKEYDVKALIISDNNNQVKFVVNGEVTDKMKEGESYTLEDGTELAVRDLLTNEGDENGEGDYVEFYLGADKLELKDNYTDNDYSADVEMNEENLEDAEVRFKATLDGDNFELSSFEYRVYADPDDSAAYVGSGEKLSAYLDEPEALLGFDFEYEGLDREEASSFKFEANGDDAYDLEFTNMRGTEYSVPFVDNSDGFKFGSDDENFVFVEGEEIYEDDYFLLTDDSDDDANSFVLSYESVDEDDQILTFTDEGTGDRYESSFSDGEGDLVVGGHTFGYTVDDEDEYQLEFDHDGDGSIDEGEYAKLVVKGEATLDFGDDNYPESEVSMTLTIDEDKFDDNEDDEETEFSVYADGDEVDLDVDSGVEMHSHDGDSDRETGMTTYGVFFDLSDEDNDPAELEVSVPKYQATASVYFSAGPSESSAVSAPSLVQVDVGAALFDSEVKAFDRNMIVVGGPCANTVASELLGYPEDCTEGFEEGKALLKLFERDGKYAMLVAGYSAQDTRRAAKVLADYENYDLEGTEVRVSGTTLSDIEVSAPEAKA